MAFLLSNLYSKSMCLETQLGVVLPQDGRLYKGKRKMKTLILLHGISDNASGWWRHTMAETYAEDYEVALLIPEVQRSFYQNLEKGPDYFTYITEELPELASKLFHISVKREDMMIAGLSMGGFGALKSALSKPERFGYCGAFSAACDIREMVASRREMAKIEDMGPKYPMEMEGNFGDDFRGLQYNDLFALAEEAAGKTEKPKIYMSCGTEDFLLGMNQRFASHCEHLELDFRFETWKGIHDWYFWDTSLKKMLHCFLDEDQK